MQPETIDCLERTEATLDPAHLARGVPDLCGGLGARVFDTVTFYVEALKPYPKLREWVRINLAAALRDRNFTAYLGGRRSALPARTSRRPSHHPHRRQKFSQPHRTTVKSNHE